MGQFPVPPPLPVPEISPPGIMGVRNNQTPQFHRTLGAP